MPVARTSPARALAAALVVTIGAVGLVVGVVLLNDQGTSSGDGVFGGLDAETLLSRQQDDGGVPFCVDDPVDGRRPICVFHTGGEVDEGWVAYDAQVDGCAFEPLSPGATELVDSCTGERYPFTGEGLFQYGVTVDDDGELAIDLDGEEPTTTTTPTTVRESGEVPTTTAAG